jgi:hypothetical protein
MFRVILRVNNLEMDSSWPIILVKMEFYFGFEVFTAVIITSSVFRNITPCTAVEVNQRFE